jgi:hypothetical protein
MAIRFSLLVLCCLALSACMPRYRLDMAFEPDQPDAPPLHTAQDRCRYEVERRAARYRATGSSEIEVRLIGQITESCMRRHGYRATRNRLVKEDA